MLDRRLTYFSELERFIREWDEVCQAVVFQAAPDLENEKSFDLAIPCFQWSKVKKLPPAKISEALAAALELAKDHLGLDAVESLNAYVNIRFRSDILQRELAAREDDPLRASREALAGERIAIDFSSPNIAKPFGFGHLRSTNIGAAICRIYQSLGAEVVRINHLGDWGTQFGKLITAYKHFGNADFVKGDPINNLYALYVKFHEEEQKDPALMDEAREWFVKLEQGNEEARELWTWFRDVSFHEFKKIYDRLGVSFDYVTGESFYNELMEASVSLIESKSLLKESEGAQVVDLESYGMPPCLIRKADGSTLYATRDIATAEYRMKTFEPTKLVYVVGSEQKLHFRQVFKVLELMGYPWGERWVHVDFGLIKSDQGKMSTRKGNIILLEDVLNQAEERALQIIEEKELTKPEERRLTPAEKKEVAKLVGLGAVIFFDLKAKRTKDIIFSWEDILNFEGDTGPYLQYSYVRLGSLLERAKAESIKWSKADWPLLAVEEERDLVRHILNFPAAVEAAAKEFEPSVISHELLELAGSFNRFYMKVPILKGESDQVAGRMHLIEMTRKLLRQGLELFGIQCPDRM